MFKFNLTNIIFQNKLKLNFVNLIRKSYQTKTVSSILELDFSPSTKPGDIILGFENLRLIGWIKSFRDQKEVKFLHLNDGSDCRISLPGLSGTSCSAGRTRAHRGQPEVAPLRVRRSFLRPGKTASG